MARADLVKKLFISFQQRDDSAFLATASEIIAEERRKHHISLANDLQTTLHGSNGATTASANQYQFEAVPRDADKGLPLLQIRQSDRFLSDLVVTDCINRSIMQIVDEFRQWEVLEANGLRPVRHILFCGPPGCGKTATAEAVASELNLPLLYVRFDGVVSSLLGETSSNLRKVFDYASRGQWVVLFDEFDAIGRARDDSTEHGEIKRVVNSYLQLMDGFTARSLVIASTNFENALDPAVWRRFDDVIRFDRPDASQIQQLAKRRLKPLKYNQDQIQLIVDNLAGSAHSDVERVCLDIRKLLALKGQSQVQNEHVLAAVERWQHRRQAMSGMDQSGQLRIDRP